MLVGKHGRAHDKFDFLVVAQARKEKHRAFLGTLRALAVDGAARPVGQRLVVFYVAEGKHVEHGRLLGEEIVVVDAPKVLRVHLGERVARAVVRRAKVGGEGRAPRLAGGRGRAAGGWC